MEQKRVFISYSRSDGSQLAEKVIALLEENDISSWRDITDMTGEHDNWPEVKLAIENAQHLVLILTPRALKSKWVKKEWSYARQEGVRVSPILVDDIEGSLMPFWQKRQQLYYIEDAESQNLLLNVLQGEGRIRKVPYDSGELIEGFIPRPHEYSEIKQALLNHHGDPVAISAALKGAGGYGKTVLSNAICQDEDIRFAFSDGVIRIVIGKERRSVTTLIVDIIEKIKGIRPGFEDLNVATEALSQAIDDAYLLLVIDDVWREQDLRPFLQASKNCAKLITTRIDDVLPRETKKFPVDQLTPVQSYALLSRDLSVGHDEYTRNGLKKLAKTLGYWAQMLSIANRWLWDRTTKGYNTKAAVIQFSKRLQQKGLTAFDPKNQDDRDRAISLCIEASIEDLSEDEIQRFQELAIFPEDEDIPLDVIILLWKATAQYEEFESEEFCNQLFSRSLAQKFSGKEKVLKLHDNMLFYLRQRYGEEALRSTHTTFLEALSEPIRALRIESSQC
jgi:hypothetical protein